MWGIVVNFEYISKVSNILCSIFLIEKYQKNILIENYYHIIINYNV